MTKKNDWHYEALTRLCIKGGEFDAWLVAVHRRNGNSACAWEIRRHGSSGIVDRRAMRSREQSTVWRGYVGALTGVAELVPWDSRVSICTRNEALRNAINGGVNDFSDDEWRKSNNDPVVAKEIWKRFLLARDGDGSRPPNTISARAPEGEDDQDILDALKEMANRLLDQEVNA